MVLPHLCLGVRPPRGALWLCRPDAQAAALRPWPPACSPGSSQPSSLPCRTGLWPWGATREGQEEAGLRQGRTVGTPTLEDWMLITQIHSGSLAREGLSRRRSWRARLGHLLLLLQPTSTPLPKLLGLPWEVCVRSRESLCVPLCGSGPGALQSPGAPSWGLSGQRSPVSGGRGAGASDARGLGCWGGQIKLVLAACATSC